MTDAQPSLFDVAAMDEAERQQADWMKWLQDDRGRWCCPACGAVEESADELHRRHGWQTDLSEIGHPYAVSWPGRYEEGGYIGQGGRCNVLRHEWLVQHYGQWPPPPVSYGTGLG